MHPNISGIHRFRLEPLPKVLGHSNLGSVDHIITLGKQNCRNIKFIVSLNSEMLLLSYF